MARIAGARKLKTLDDKITANQSKIEEYENALVELKAERKILLEQKDQEDVQEIIKSIKDSGLSIAEAKAIFIKNKA
jgi:TolA-binding protein